MPLPQEFRRIVQVTCVAMLSAALVSLTAWAQQPELPASIPAPAAAEAPAPGLWINGIHLSAQIEAGLMGNPSRPADGLNFGQLFTDHANQIQLNQLSLQQTSRSTRRTLTISGALRCSQRCQRRSQDS